MSRIKIPSQKVYKDHINKYSQYSESPDWAEWYSKVAPLKGLRVTRTILNYKKSNAKVLDLGCGTGMTLSTLAQSFPNAVGCEVDENVANAARDFLKIIGLKNKIYVYNGNRLPFRSDYFDVVTSIEVVEHVEDSEKMLSEIKRVLKKDGILHITTANKWWPIEPHFKLPFLSYLPYKWADFYVRLFKKGDSYQNIHLPSYSEFLRLVNKDFKVEDITLEVIKNYKAYKMDKERGYKVVLLGNILNILSISNLSVIRKINKLMEYLLVRVSLGWLFIGYPKKN